MFAPPPSARRRDTLIDRGRGVEFPADWAKAKGVPPEQILDTLRRLLESPVELVLTTHGAATDRTALDRALSRTCTTGLS